MTTYNINSLPTDLVIGRQTETGVTDIRIDCAPWLAIWPELTLSIWVTPPGGAAAYPAATHLEGDTLVWDVNSGDTAVEGKGTMEVMGLAEGLKKLSSITTTQVLRTTTEVTSEPPEPAQTWVDQVLAARDEAEQAAERAEEIAEALAGYEGGSGTGSGTPGQDGEDGFSPIATVTQTEGGAVITITDASGTTTATVQNGVDGQDGQPGADGQDGSDGVGISNIYQKTYSLEDGGENVYVVELTDGTISNFKVRNGNKGKDGVDGAAGAAGADGNGIKSAVLNADYTLMLTFDDGTSYTTPSIRGETGPAGPAGKDGQDGEAGAAGKDGTSVTVKSVSESTEDGGSNVVTFSDGKTLTVKNGSKGTKGDTGADGYTPVKGIDYHDGAKGDKGDSYILTDADKQEIANIVPIVKVAETPKIVESVDDMEDTTKHYVLDGYIWHYKTVVTPGETTTTYPNQLVPGAATLNVRYSGSSQSTTTKVGYFVTDYIAVPDFASVSPYNARMDWEVPFSTATDVKIVFFNASKAHLGMSYIAAANTSVANGATTVDLRTQSSGTAPTVSEVAYVRLQLAVNSSMASLAASDIENLTITLDAVYETESTESVTTQTWVSTGIVYNQPADYEDRVISLETNVANNTGNIAMLQDRVSNLESGEVATVIPEWWEDEVADTIAKIKALQVGRACVTFPFFSDNHQRNGYAGALIAKVMEECGIPYAFFGGDTIANGYIDSEATMIAQDAAFDDCMAPVPDGRFCRAVGNHDGFWAVSSTENYTYTRDQVYDLFLRAEGVAQNKHFGVDGTYYYVDDIVSKTRWVIVNTNGGSVDATQIAWIQDVALTFPESGWAVVFISHHPITNHYTAGLSNAAEVHTVLKDYINSTAATKADVVGWWSGHIHRDKIYEGVAANPGYNGSTDTETDAAEGDPISETLPWKTVTIISDNTAIGYGGVKHAIDNSDQSHAIDFVTINKATKTVNLTRLGFGDDRSFTY